MCTVRSSGGRLITNLPAFLAGPPLTGEEVSVTGKRVPARKGGIFRESPDSQQMLKQWQDVHNDAQRSLGVLSIEVDLASGEEAVLVHHVFADSRSKEQYFAATATEHAKDLLTVVKPELHLVRGRTVSPRARAGISGKGVPAKFGEWDLGYVREGKLAPDGEQAIQVTAQWSCDDD